MIDALIPVIVLLAAGLAAALVSRAVRLSPIVGYILAGLAIGPFGLGLIEQTETTRLLADLGVAFLLFEIGAQFSVQQAIESRRDMFGAGLLQMALCTAALGGGAMLLGFPPASAFIIGGALALSSTAVAIAVLSEQKALSCPIGRSSIAILVIQDICGIFLLVAAVTLALAPDALAGALSAAALKATLAAAFAFAAGRFAIKPLFRTLAATRNDEVFVATTLLLVLAAAAATQSAGLSMTLGAFLAGMAVSESPYRHVVLTEVKPFRGLLLSFFFISVGMSLDIPALLPLLGHAALMAAAILTAKTALTALAARAVGWSTPQAARGGFLLAQASEFSFVILALPVLAEGAPAGATGALVAAAALTLAFAPAWAALGERLARRLAERRKTAPAPALAAGPDQRPVIVYGLGEVGRLAVDALRDHDRPVIALEPDPDRFAAAVADGYDPIFGDPSNLNLIDLIAGSRARGIVISIPRFEISKQITPMVRERYPDLLRFVAVADAADKARHAALGMRAHISRTEPLGMELAADLLTATGVGPEAIARWIAERADRAGRAPPFPAPAEAA